MNKTQTKKQLASAKRYLKGIKNNRAILKYVDYQEGYQVFTDSFTAYRMKNHINELPYHNNELGNYPNLKRFIPNYKECENVTKLNDLNEGLLLAGKMKEDKVKTIKSKKYAYYIVSDYDKACINPLLLKQVLDILQDNIDNIEVYFLGSLRPVLFKNSRGDEAIIMPIRFE